MSLKEILALIENIANKYLIDKPYLVGGVPRDIYLEIPSIQTTDLDITTNSTEVLRLGILIADHLNVTFELSEDGHITVFSDEFDIDFSSHFISPKVVDYLDNKFAGLEEAFSRDFTINTLHQDLITNKITDPTGKGFDDIKNKLIRTPVPCEITLSDDPRRAYRAVNLAARYGFEIDEEIKAFTRDNPGLFLTEKIKDKYIAVKMSKALKQNPDLTIKLLKEMNLFSNVPLTGMFKDILIERKMLIEYLNSQVNAGMVKSAVMIARDWNEYVAQGPAYQLIKDWWTSNYSKIPGDKNLTYNSWVNWYTNKYNSEWNRVHKDPEETLQIMKGEAKNSLNRKDPEITDRKQKLLSLLNPFKKNKKNITETSNNLVKWTADDIINAYGISSILADKIVEVSDRIGLPNPAFLANVINFESKFNPAIQNSIGATGLIQFIPTTAQELGTTTDELKKMSAEAQMEYVYNYFMLPRIKRHGPLMTQEDVYMAVFYPVAIGKPDFVFPNKVQEQNFGFKTPKDYAEMANSKSRNYRNKAAENYKKVEGGNVYLKSGADIDNVSSTVKSFITELGNVAKEINAETPIITSGWRSEESQAKIMANNWKNNGGLNGGREYLEKLYGKNYGDSMANIFEKYGTEEIAIRLGTSFVKIRSTRGSNHVSNPGKALDLAITDRIKDVLNIIKSEGRFNIDIGDETKYAGPHYHVSIHGENLEKTAIFNRIKKIKNIQTTNS